MRISRTILSLSRCMLTLSHVTLLQVSADPTSTLPFPWSMTIMELQTSFPPMIHCYIFLIQWKQQQKQKSIKSLNLSCLRIRRKSTLISHIEMDFQRRG